MKRLLFLLVFLSFSAALGGQARQHIEYDGNYYRMDLRDLLKLCDDFYQNEPDHHARFNPELDRWRRRQQDLTFATIASAAGGTVMLASAIDLFKNPDAEKVLFFGGDAWGWFAASAALYSISVISLIDRQPRKRDALRLINQINQASSGAKIRLVLQVEPIPGGMALGMGFRHQLR
jgi:hypothetical protein